MSVANCLFIGSYCSIISTRIAACDSHSTLAVNCSECYPPLQWPTWTLSFQINSQTKNPYMECCICNDEAANFVALDACSHNFHRECIVKWIKIRKTCPLCVQPFEDILSLEAKENKTILNELPFCEKRGEQEERKRILDVFRNGRHGGYGLVCSICPIQRLGRIFHPAFSIWLILLSPIRWKKLTELR